MSNRMDSRQHGMHRIERIRPNAKLNVKLRKAKARVGQALRHEAIMEARANFMATV
ncbi:MAG: hypothetical protein WCJ84_02140 [Candidatus Peregrinibacteria bacterium]